MQRGSVCLVESERVRFFYCRGTGGEWAREGAIGKGGEDCANAGGT